MKIVLNLPKLGCKFGRANLFGFMAFVENSSLIVITVVDIFLFQICCLECNENLKMTLDISSQMMYSNILVCFIVVSETLIVPCSVQFYSASLICPF